MSKLFLCLLLSIFTSAGIVHAQHNYTQCRYTYYKNKKISTAQCYDKDNRWGKAKAFDIQGNLIYEKELRRVAGHSSVEFTFYDNGAVQKAAWHSAPDAGIQWYNTTTYFSKEGKIEREEENNYDQMVTVNPTITHQNPSIKEIKKPEVVSCAVIYTTEFWYINKTKYPIQVIATRKGMRAEVKTTVIQPGDTVMGGNFIIAEQFVDLNDFYDYEVKYLKNNNKKARNLVFYQLSTNPVRKDLKRTYYVIR